MEKWFLIEFFYRGRCISNDTLVIFNSNFFQSFCWIEILYSHIYIYIPFEYSLKIKLQRLMSQSQFMIMQLKISEAKSNEK